jgi:3-hydroxyisobutyrate dehydrogenase-like beta-hydroxyacid dehydrogenase
MRIAFIGLGLMGSRMAANLIDKGFTLAVYNRTQSRAEPLAARGATVAHTPRAVVTGADVSTGLRRPRRHRRGTRLGHDAGRFLDALS